MIIGCFLPRPMARFVARHPSLLRLERSFSLSALRFLLECLDLKSAKSPWEQIGRSGPIPSRSA
jgi:hypothetical protein